MDCFDSVDERELEIILDKNEVKTFINSNQSEQTIAKTKEALSKFQTFLKSIGKENVDLKNLSAEEMDNLISNWIIKINSLANT